MTVDKNRVFIELNATILSSTYNCQLIEEIENSDQFGRPKQIMQPTCYENTMQHL